MEAPIRLLALDLDGTLLSSDLSVSARNQQAVARCLDLGVHVVLASGRIYPSIDCYTSLWPGHSLWIISCNGSVIRPAGGRVALSERLVPMALAREVAAWAEHQGLYLKTYVDDRLIVSEVTEETLRFTKAHGVAYQVVPSVADHLTKGPTKMVILDAPERIASLEREVTVRWGGLLEVTASGPDGLEFTQAGVTKGSALELLAQHLGASAGHSAAVGNERNDLSMILWAGYGAAMGDAPHGVQEAAPRVVPGDQADGVARFIEGWLDYEKVTA